MNFREYLKEGFSSKLKAKIKIVGKGKKARYEMVNWTYKDVEKLANWMEKKDIGWGEEQENGMGSTVVLMTDEGEVGSWNAGEGSIEKELYDIL